MNNDLCLPIYCSTGCIFGNWKQYNSVPYIYIPYSHIVKMKIVSTWWECQISQNLCIDNPVNIPIKI